MKKPEEELYLRDEAKKRRQGLKVTGTYHPPLNTARGYIPPFVSMARKTMRT